MATRKKGTGKRRIISKDDDLELEEELDEEFEEEDEPPKKRTRSKKPGQENENSLCASCGHRAICYKRRSIMEQLDMARESLSLGDSRSLAQFSFQGLVDECEDYIPQIETVVQDDGTISYEFKMTSDRITIKRRK